MGGETATLDLEGAEKFLRMLGKTQGLETAHVYLEGHGDLVSRSLIRITRVTIGL